MTYENTYSTLVDMGELGMSTIKDGVYETKEELQKIMLIMETILNLATIFRNKK